MLDFYGNPFIHKKQTNVSYNVNNANNEKQNNTKQKHEWDCT